MKTTTVVKLRFYQDSDRKALNAFSLSEEQEEFTVYPREALKICKLDIGRRPVVISADDEPVGFFVLHSGEEIGEYSTNPDAILLRAFCIDRGSQGKGVAKAAMKQLPSFTEKYFQDKNEIILAVNLRNFAAKSLYRKAGFYDTGTQKLGRKGPMHIFSFHL